MVTEREEQSPLPQIETAVIECPVDDAKEKGAEMWGIKADDIEATIVSEDKKLFGLLKSTYKIEIRPFAPVSYIRSCHLSMKYSTEWIWI